MRILTGFVFLGLTGVTCGLGKECADSLCTIDDKSIRFIAIGDWGGTDEPPYVTKGQAQCANFMQQIGPQKTPQFFVGAGDNFYQKGVSSVDDPRFKETFDDVFLYGKDTSIPWYMTAGNRDWFGNVSAQIEYTQRNSRWVFPDYAYFTQFTTRPDGPSLDIIFIDTVILCGNKPDNGPKNGPDQLPGPADKAQAENMWTFTEQHMANSTADYLFVVGHYQTFASDHHNISDCLVPRLLNLLEKYNATGYIAGHTHNLQHLTTVSPTNRTLHHIVSGAGHQVESIFEPLNLTSNPWQLESQFFFPKESDQMTIHNETGGLVYAELGTQSGTMEYYKCDGTLLYSFQFEPRTVTVE